MRVFLTLSGKNTNLLVCVFLAFWLLFIYSIILMTFGSCGSDTAVIICQAKS